MAKNYYEILGVNEDAQETEIKQAFRRLAKEYHPDTSRHENAKELFQEIGEAYGTLSDATKRQEYNRFLEGQKRAEGNDLNGAIQFAINDIFASIFGASNPNDLFQGMFSGFPSQVQEDSFIFPENDIALLQALMQVYQASRGNE